MVGIRLLKVMLGGALAALSLSSMGGDNVTSTASPLRLEPEKVVLRDEYRYAAMA